MYIVSKMTEVLQKLDFISLVDKDRKIKLLKEYVRTDKLFNKIVYLSTKRSKNFSIKFLPIVRDKDQNLIDEIHAKNEDEIVEQIFFHLNVISDKNNNTLDDIKKSEIKLAILSDKIKDGRLIVNRIINKNLKAIGSVAIGKALPGLFKLPPSKVKKNNIKSEIFYPAICEEVISGYSIRVIVEDEKIKFFTVNNGRFYAKNKKLEKEILEISNGYDIALIGSLKMDYRSKAAFRKDVKLNMLSSTTKNKKNTKNIDIEEKFYVWEVLPLEDFFEGVCGTNLIDRYNSNFFKYEGDLIKFPRREIVDSKNDIKEFRDKNKCDVIIKNDLIWKGGFDWIEP